MEGFGNPKLYKNGNVTKTVLISDCGEWLEEEGVLNERFFKKENDEKDKEPE